LSRPRIGERLNRVHAWLDDTCGADAWSITPARCAGSSTTRSHMRARTVPTISRRQHPSASTGPRGS